jgi:stress-induced morphogen
MEINKDNIEKKLRDEFEPTYLVNKKIFYIKKQKFSVSFFQNVEDCSDGCGLKFETTIVSKKFEGKQLLARQRYVRKFSY